MYKQINKKFYAKWEKVIYTFINKEIQAGKNVLDLMSNENNYDYWFLRRLNENIGFWKEGKLVNVKI